MQAKDGFTLFTREEFKDWLMNSKFYRKITLVQNHHTWMPSYRQFNGTNHFRMLSGMKDYHIRTAGFSDIAQNLSTFPDGTIAVCRSFEKAPAGIYGANTGGLCIEHVGNFDFGGDEMTKEHKETIIFLNAVLCMKFGLPINDGAIVYHHWYDLNSGTRLDYGGKAAAGSTKTCPGTNFFGGNTVDSARAKFYPLVQAKLNALIAPVIEEVMKMFLDEDKIGAWAKPSVERLVQLGLLKGDDKGNFNPQNPLTREQFAVVIDRLLQMLGK